MKKKFQILTLIILLLAVIGGGIWFLTGGSEPGENSDPTDTPDTQRPEDGGFDWLSAENVRCKTTGSTERSGAPLWGYEHNYERFFTYQGQLCQLSVTGEDLSEFTVQLLSVADGSVLKSYDQACFVEDQFFDSLYLDEEGQLWALYWSGLEIPAVGRCEPGLTLEDTEPLPMADASGQALTALYECSVTDFAVWGDFVVAAARNYQAEKDLLFIFDRSVGTVQSLELWVTDLCIDRDGDLYFIYSAENGYPLVKYSLRDGRSLWENRELPSGLRSLWYSDGTLFLMGGVPEQEIFTIDTETGASRGSVFSFWTQSDLRPEMEAHSRYTQFRFGIDASGFMATACVEETSGRGSYVRLTWTLEPYILELAPEDMVTLTITAPYPVESVEGAIQMYQQEHPEVQVVWDTQYISREEFRPNILEYKDQIALRMMTGDVGDIQMISGSGLSLDVVTDTDTFMDLTAYLDACPFRDELEWDLLDPLRDADGAVRALPLGISPSYAIYNATLLEQLDSPIDPDTVTWSGLLDLALQWKGEGTDLSLTSCFAGEESAAKENILTSLLLANLYDAQQSDGTVQLDQPYLRELLTKLKDLWNSRQLVRTDGNYVVEGFFERSLFMTFPSTLSVTERLNCSVIIPQREDVVFRAAPMPWGEVYHGQQGYAFCWGIPATSQQKEAAWDLLQFLVSSEGFPGYSYSEDTELLNNTAQELWYEQYIRVVQGGAKGFGQDFFEQTQALRKLPVSRFDEPYGWYDAVCAPILEFMSDEVTLDEALETANDNWERFILE